MYQRCSSAFPIPFSFMILFIYTRLEYYGFHHYFGCASSKKGYLNSESLQPAGNIARITVQSSLVALTIQCSCFLNIFSSFWLLPAILLRNANRRLLQLFEVYVLADQHTFLLQTKISLSVPRQIWCLVHKYCQARVEINYYCTKEGFFNPEVYHFKLTFSQSQPSGGYLYIVHQPNVLLIMVLPVTFLN